MTMTTEINTAIAERARAGASLTEAELAELDAVDVLSLGMLADEVRRVRAGIEVTYARVLEVRPSAAASVPAEQAAQADEIRVSEPGVSLVETARLVERLRNAAGRSARITGFSLAGLRDTAWDSLPAMVTTLQHAGLDAVAEAQVDLVAPAEIDAVLDAGVEIGALSVQRPFDAGRVALVMRFREIIGARSALAMVAPLAREQSVAAPTTGYHDVRLVALARLALPAIRTIAVDWEQYGPKLAQVALTFGASHLDRVSLEDDPSLGRRRSRVEDVRRNITAAGFVPVGQEAGR